MISTLLSALAPGVLHRAWVISDLQQSQPAQARRCMTRAVDDFKALALPVDQVWYLGDAVEGERLDALEEMAAMQVELLAPLGVSVKYVLGNHDFDHLRHTGGASGRTAVFRDTVLRVPGWRTTDSVDAFHFVDRLGPFTVLFLSDHADPACRWVSTHGKVHGDWKAYPHDARAYRAVRDRIAAVDGPVITCSHYAFSGGNRPSVLHDLMLPLPPNVRLHLYGHAHIGDATWAGKDLYRKISCVDDHPIVQVDVASLEDDRGSAIRSAVLEVYQDLSLGVFFRNHTIGRWEDALILDGRREIGEVRGAGAT